MPNRLWACTAIIIAKCSDNSGSWFSIYIFFWMWLCTSDSFMAAIWVHRNGKWIYSDIRAVIEFFKYITSVYIDSAKLRIQHFVRAIENFSQPHTFSNVILIILSVKISKRFETDLCCYRFSTLSTHFFLMLVWVTMFCRAKRYSIDFYSNTGWLWIKISNFWAIN